jgi:hypothetical protein
LLPTFWNAVAANLVSPARGLLIFAPLVLFSLVGLWLSRRNLNSLHALAVLTVGLHLAVVSNTAIWWGGYSYGPRFMSDVLPFLFFLMVPVIDRITRVPMKAATAGLAAVFVAATAWSVFANAKGALDWDTAGWNFGPSVDTHPDRVWDWNDLPMLRTGNKDYEDFYG